MRIAIAQTNSTVGDLRGNVDRMIRFSRAQPPRGAEVVVFPELSLTGYPPRDLLEKRSFLERTEAELETPGDGTRRAQSGVICGTVTRSDADPPASVPLQRRGGAARVAKSLFRQNKMLLPTYDVFDEARYFGRGDIADRRCTLRRRDGRR